MTGGVSLVQASGLNKRYTAARGGGVAYALLDVSISINRGETLALVGESGCGKSTLGRTLVALQPPDTGRVTFDGVDIASLSPDAVRLLRRRIQIIFQDAGASLDPRLTAGASVREGLTVHRLAEGAAGRCPCQGTVRRSGPRAPICAARFPHELSSGQRQRVAIARTLAVDPEFIVLDEPLTALDVSIQAQIIGLLMKLQRARKLTYLFITHDLAVAERVATRMAVMYLGRIVEEGPAGIVDLVAGPPLHDHPALIGPLALDAACAASVSYCVAIRRPGHRRQVDAHFTRGVRTLRSTQSAGVQSRLYWTVMLGIASRAPRTLLP